MQRYQANYSAIGKAGGWFPLMILFCWTIIPVLIYLIHVINVKKQKIYVDDSIPAIITEDGFWSTSKKEQFLSGVLAISVEQSIFGRLLDYGNVHINCVGKHCDLYFYAVKDPYGFASYLKKFKTEKNINQVIAE